MLVFSNPCPNLLSLFKAKRFHKHNSFWNKSEVNLVCNLFKDGKRRNLPFLKNPHGPFIHPLRGELSTFVTCPCKFSNPRWLLSYVSLPNNLNMQQSHKWLKIQIAKARINFTTTQDLYPSNQLIIWWSKLTRTPRTEVKQPC